MKALSMLHGTAVLLASLALSPFSCGYEPSEPQRPASTKQSRVAAARALNMKFFNSRFRAWGIDVHSAGAGCSVLVIKVWNLILEDTMVKELHSGGTAPWTAEQYRLVPGGVGRYATAHGFKGVVYIDSRDTKWVSGNVTERWPTLNDVEMLDTLLASRTEGCW